MKVTLVSKGSLILLINSTLKPYFNFDLHSYEYILSLFYHIGAMNLRLRRQIHIRG